MAFRSADVPLLLSSDQLFPSKRSSVPSVPTATTLVVLVPQGKGLFSSLDHGMGHQRRFEASELGQMLADTGFSVLEEKQLNKFGALSWWLFGKVMGRTKMNRVMLKLWDKTVWFWRRIDGILPGRGLSLVMVARAK